MMEPLKSEVNMSTLTENEKKAVLRVLNRDMAIRNLEEKRILCMKSELRLLRKRGALRPGVDSSTSCARCLTPLGFLFNTGAPCDICLKKVCNSCRQYHAQSSKSKSNWSCIVCAKQMELKIATGEWMKSFEPTSTTDTAREKLEATVARSEWLREDGFMGICNKVGKPQGDSSSTSSSISLSSHASCSPAPPRLETERFTDNLLPKQTASTSQLSPELFEVARARHNFACSRENNNFSPLKIISSDKGFTSNQTKDEEDGSSQDSFQIPSRSSLKKYPTRPPSSPRTPESFKRCNPQSNSRRSLEVKECSIDNSKPQNSPTFKRCDVTQGAKSRTSVDTDSPPYPHRIPRRKETLQKSSETFHRLESRKKINYDSADDLVSNYRKSNESSDDFNSDLTSDLASESSFHLESSLNSRPLCQPNSISPQAYRRIVISRKYDSSSLSESEIESAPVDSEDQEPVFPDKTDENALAHRSSPRGRLRARNSKLLSNSSDEGVINKAASVPQIMVSDHAETGSVKGSQSISDRDSVGVSEDDMDQSFNNYSRSQISLFGTRSESMSSVYSAAGGGRYGAVIVTGEIFFSLMYNYKASNLVVYIKECKGLASVDSKRNRSDPYVKVYLLPDKTKSGKRKTKVKKHTLNPAFDETLKFAVTMSELETRTMWLSVWHSDIFGRNDFLGEVMLPLSSKVIDAMQEIQCYPLQERMESNESSIGYKGDIILSLKFVPPDVTRRKANRKVSGSLNSSTQSVSAGSKGSLHVLVKEARNLMATRSNGTSDPFCKCYLLPDKTKSGKQKTQLVKKSCNPKWNHTFVYDDISTEELKDRCLELTIWDYDKITSNDFLGGVRMNLGTGKHQNRDVDWMDAQGEELVLWRSMVDRPNQWIDASLMLRSTMARKIQS